MTKKHFNLISGKKDLTNNTSSYADICSKITTSNVVETTTRGGDSYYKACSRIVTSIPL
ncbi:MAG: hypothetical protein FWG85_02245 [Bacteroidetes bacterium]|nr:hypothetical protein [Bacteroidota bacterium]